MIRARGSPLNERREVNTPETYRSVDERDSHTPFAFLQLSHLYHPKFLFLSGFSVLNQNRLIWSHTSS
jgi:hypothetical protein